MADAPLPAVPHLLKEYFGLLQPGTGQRIMSLDSGPSAQQSERGSDAPGITQFTVERKALLAPGLRPFCVIQGRSQFCCRVERPGSQQSCYPLTSCQCPLQKELPFSCFAAVMPEPAEGDTQSQGVFGMQMSPRCSCQHVCLLQEKTERSAQVLLLAFQLCRPTN